MFEPPQSEDEITARLDSSELADAHEERRKDVLEVHTQVSMGARTDLGRVRENNEDKFDFIIPDEPELLANNGSLYAVADGMGGHAAGQIASELALKTLIQSYYSVVSWELDKRLRRAISEANRLVYDTARAIPDRSGMGTTIVLAVVREKDLFIVHVGDSRAYLIRNGEIKRLTTDHSWVAEQVARGSMTEDEALRSPFKNVITRSLGIQPFAEPDISVHSLEEGDRILLCTDGLTTHLSDADILGLALQGSPSQACLKLVIEACERGGQDNTTVMLLRIDNIEGEVHESNTPAELESDENTSSPNWLSKILKHGT